jgi:hypothetical protein
MLTERRGASGQALGRLPWLAAFLRRARRLRPVLLIGVLLDAGQLLDAEQVLTRV